MLRWSIKGAVRHQLQRSSAGGAVQQQVCQQESCTPCCGTISMSPSALARQLSSIDVLARYT